MKTKTILILLSLLCLVVMGCFVTDLVSRATGVGQGIQEASDIAEGLIEESGLKEELENLDVEEELENLNIEESAQEFFGERDYNPEGYKELDSYRMKVEITTEKANGETEQQNMEIAYTREPEAQEYVITGIMGDDEDQMRMIKIENKQWIQYGDEWIQTELPDDGEDMTADLTDVMDEVDQTFEEAEDLGVEEVNGIRARHYRVENEDLYGDAEMLVDELESATMDFWVAEEADMPAFLVKSEYRIKGKAESDESIVGYYVKTEIWDINAPITIMPPDDSETGGGVPEDIPVVDNHDNLTVMGGVIVYTTSDDYQSVVSFYETQMPANGWEKTSTAISTATVTMAEYSKSGQSLTLSIAADEGSGEVTVTIMIQG